MDMDKVVVQQVLSRHQFGLSVSKDQLKKALQAFINLKQGQPGGLVQETLHQLESGQALSHDRVNKIMDDLAKKHQKSS